MQDNYSTALLETAEPGATQVTEAPTVPALGYGQLRLLAECAVVNNREMDFYFQGGTTLFEGLPPEGSADTDVVVYAQDSGRHPGNQVTLEAVYQNIPVRLDLELGKDDAVFWADAAVQKFVFPYVASCGGDDGGARLRTLQDAWNNYPGGEVTVYALVQRSWLSPAAELDLDLVIHVVYVAHPTAALEPALEMTTLRAFGEKYRPGLPQAQPVQPVPYVRGSGGVPQRPSYTTLRAMADWACSLSDEPEYFVFRAGQVGFETPLPTALTPLGPGDFMVPAMTPTVPAGRPTLASVLLRPGGSTVPPENLAVKADAVFWSTGCIEQFVFPYYASKTGFGGMSGLVDMIYAWTGAMPVLSRNPQVNDQVDALLREGAPEGPTGEQVAGLIHLHTSEWIEITEEGQIAPTQTDRVDPTRQLAVVSTDPLGNTRVERMDRFMARKRAGQ